MTEERDWRGLGFEAMPLIGVEAVRWIGVSARLDISASLSEDGVGRAVGYWTDFAFILASWALTIKVELSHSFFPCRSRVGRASNQCGCPLQFNHRIKAFHAFFVGIEDIGWRQMTADATLAFRSSKNH